MGEVSIGGNRFVIHVDKMNNRKHPVLFVDTCYESEYGGEKVQKIKITPVAHFKNEEAAKIFEDTLRRMFENGGEVKLIHNFDEYCECMSIDTED